MKKIYCIAMLVSCLACSCSAVRSVDDMKQNTDNMGRDTSKMAEKLTLTQQQMDNMNGNMSDMANKLDGLGTKIGELGDKIDGMGNALDKMYGDLRMGDSLQARLRSLDEMNATKLLVAKTAHASHFFISFEYQLWKAEGLDSPKTQLGLIDDAVREFATLAQKYMESDARTVSVISEDNSVLNLYALALCMHMKNPSTQRILQSKNVDFPSMFDLIQSGFRAGADLKTGVRKLSDLKPFEISVLEYEDVFQYLFELRANMFPAMVIGNLSTADATNPTQKWWSRGNLFLHPWNAQTEVKNAAQIRMYAAWLTEAVFIKKFMRSLGAEPRFDGMLLKTLKNMRFPEISTSETQETEKQLELIRLSNLHQQFLAE